LPFDHRARTGVQLNPPDNVGFCVFLVLPQHSRPPHDSDAGSQVYVALEQCDLFA
jgi:hypothetical protein